MLGRLLGSYISVTLCLPRAPLDVLGPFRQCGESPTAAGGERICDPCLVREKGNRASVGPLRPGPETRVTGTNSDNRDHTAPTIAQP
jgi:hypothetical protein